MGFAQASLAVTQRRVRIPDLAKGYVVDLLRVQPTGPYRLAGYSFGGPVALEIAHQLEQLGHEVALLAFIDREPPLPSRARHELAQLASLLQRRETFAAYVRRRMANARIKAGPSISLVVHWLHLRTGRSSNQGIEMEEVEADHETPLSRLLMQALWSYAAPRTNCSITYFRAGVQTDRGLVQMPHGEEGTDDCYVIDGPDISHFTLMAEPHVRLLADALTDRLDRIDSHTCQLPAGSRTPLVTNE